MTDNEIVERLVESGLDDWVMIHEVVWESTQGVVTQESKQTALRVLNRLYGEHLMIPGALGDAGFEDWSPPAAGWLRRSAQEIDRLDWKPRGAGFWLRLTERGKQLAHERSTS